MGLAALPSACGRAGQHFAQRREIQFGRAHHCEDCREVSRERMGGLKGGVVSEVVKVKVWRYSCVRLRARAQLAEA